MKRKDLLVFGSTGNYDPPMSDTELWKAVGRYLAQKRLAVLNASPKTFSRKRRVPGKEMPDPATIELIEQGDIRTITRLNAYCDVLGLKVSEVLAAVLPTPKASAEAMDFAKQYDAVIDAPQASQETKDFLRETVKSALQIGRAQARSKSGGDGHVEPVKKGGRSERSR